jgi:hypothetical protein
MAFSWYKSVTIDHTKVPSTQTNFPVLVSVTDADLKTVGNGGYVQNSSGYDIGFYSDSSLTTKLDWETERYIASTGEVIYWVRIASLSSSSDTVFYMAFGDSGISTDQSNKTGVWDSNSKLVWHLSDGTTLSVSDSTSNANNGTNNGANAATGKMDGAAIFVAASNQTISAPSPSFVSNLTSYSISSWFKTSSSAARTIYGEGNSGDDGPLLFVTLNEGGPGEIRFFQRDNGFNSFYITDSSGWNDGNWHLVDAVRSSSSAWELFVDGASKGTSGSSVGTTTVNQSTIAALPRTSTDRYFDGSIDEFRISNIARSADWITTEYNNQSSPSAFESFGSRTAVSGGGVSTASSFLQLLGVG